jgi:uncharacterized membrane protein
MADQKETVIYSQEDINANKGMSVLAYFIFFIPLLVESSKNSPYAKFHVNQGFLVFLVYIASVVINIIPILGWILSPILWIAGLVFLIMGVINALNGVGKELPLIGSITLIK